MGGKDFEQILPSLQEARKNGHWVVLAGHGALPGWQGNTRSNLPPVYNLTCCIGFITFISTSVNSYFTGGSATIVLRHHRH